MLLGLKGGYLDIGCGYVRGWFTPVPAWSLKHLLGEIPRLLLTGQRAVPEKAQAMGFRFHYTDFKISVSRRFVHQ